MNLKVQHITKNLPQTIDTKSLGGMLRLERWIAYIMHIML
jgi:hypothetical protein